ncbi:hypothetical protein O23A_p2266 [Aeromonas salmonicida]|nr:hypothetical protein O23A_p2266 [Aeromonas salmonicida]
MSGITFVQNELAGVVRWIPHQDPLNNEETGQMAGKKKAGTEAGFAEMR